MEKDVQKLQEILGALYDTSYDSNEREHSARKERFVFHMLDWIEDFEKLFLMYREPEKYSIDEARKIVQEFLYHASGHIAAAARLYDAFLDPFGPEGSKDS